MNILFESKKLGEIEDFLKHLMLNSERFKLGDGISTKFDSMIESYVVVLNDSDFLDVEYRLKSTQKVYSNEEMEEILKALK